MKDEWYWAGSRGNYDLVKGSLIVGRIYRTSRALGNGLTQRGWGVAKNKDPMHPRWWDKDSYAFVSFLEYMPLKEAQTVAKVLLLSGEV